MSETDEVLSSLKLTPKGQLNYARDWDGQDGIKVILYYRPHRLVNASVYILMKWAL